jgi:hypothetical protein
MWVLNNTATKKAILTIAEQERYHEFSRVQESYLIKLNSMLIEYIRGDIRTLPSKGKTIK